MTKRFAGLAFRSLSRSSRKRGQAGGCPSRAGYSLVEVLIAAGLVALGIGAAALLAMTMVSQQDASARVVRALNYQEQAARLYQLGLPVGSITNILPRESGVTVTFLSTNSVTNATIGTYHLATCRMVVTTTNFSSTASQTNEVYLVRPSLR